MLSQSAGIKNERPDSADRASGERGAPLRHHTELQRPASSSYRNRDFGRFDSSAADRRPLLREDTAGSGGEPAAGGSSAPPPSCEQANGLAYTASSANSDSGRNNPFSVGNQPTNGLSSAASAVVVPSIIASKESGIGGETQVKSTNSGGVDWTKVVQAAQQQYKTMNGAARRRQATQDLGKAEVSLCCLSLKNPFRKLCIRIVEWK